MCIPCPLDSILDAVFTVSPNKQYLGILSPTTPATHGPRKIKIYYIFSFEKYILLTVVRFYLDTEEKKKRKKIYVCIITMYDIKRHGTF